jgi:hypothetical protein
MRLLYIVLLLALKISSIAQTPNPFLSLHYDKVLICDFENDGEHDYPLVDEKGKLTNVVKKSIMPDRQITSDLVLKLGDRKSYGQHHAMCNEPHFGIIFFNRSEEVAEVQICLGCNVLTSTLLIPAQQQGKAGTGKHIYYTRDGMSRQFRHSINELIKKYGLSHPIEPNSSFDKVGVGSGTILDVPHGG